jgi:hypothetical protein
MLVVNVPTDPDTILSQQDEDDAFYAAALREMVALGLDIGRIIHQQVVAQALDSPHSPIDDQSSVSYDRIFRAVRRGILLAKHLKKPVPPPKPANQGEAHRQIPRKLGDMTESQQPSRDKRDRLDTLDPIEDLENRPPQEIIDQISKDLGLATTALLPLPLGEGGASQGFAGVSPWNASGGRGEGLQAGTTPEPPAQQQSRVQCALALHQPDSPIASPTPIAPPEPAGPPYPPGS